MKRNGKLLLLMTSVLILGVFAIWGLTAAQQWHADKDGHYHLTASGERIGFEAHSMVDNRCSVCNTKVTNLPDGRCIVIQYNSKGREINNKEYIGGRLAMEAEFKYIINGDTIPARAVFYNEDGSFEREEYDDHANLSKKTYYDAQGNAGDVYTYERQYSKYEDLKSCKTYLNGRLIEETEYGPISCTPPMLPIVQKTEYHEDGSKTVYKYDDNGNLKKVTTYDPDGNVKWD